MTFTDDELRKALLDGYGRRAITPEYGTPDFGMVENLRRNVYQLSVAKNHHQLRALTDTLIDDEGRVRSFSEFQTEARKIDSRYNVDYLRTEYDTAVGRGCDGFRVGVARSARRGSHVTLRDCRRRPRARLACCTQRPATPHERPDMEYDTTRRTGGTADVWCGSYRVPRHRRSSYGCPTTCRICSRPIWRRPDCCSPGITPISMA